jgi:hypothetical protein
MYSLLLETYIKDSAEKNKLFHAIDTVPCVQKKAAWAMKWIESADTFAERLIAFAAIEGIFFSGRCAGDGGGGPGRCPCAARHRSAPGTRSPGRGGRHRARQTTPAAS